jgi:hypothetical protein
MRSNTEAIGETVQVASLEPETSRRFRPVAFALCDRVGDELRLESVDGVTQGPGNGSSRHVGAGSFLHLRPRCRLRVKTQVDCIDGDHLVPSAFRSAKRAAEERVL